MRTYKLIDAFETISESFAFLHKEWRFELIKEENLNYACVLEYQKNQLIIRIAYDYKDNFFYFSFILSGERIPIIKLFEEKEPNVDWRLFEPDDSQYKESLMRNIEYVKKYKNDIVKMAEI
ncbi:MAG: hypothetical protein LBE13_20835 [Bacteroidales bacterium]|jgi:hypothetical protein|nr:hypothetical protein [Bacteroidales bacterium]